MQNSYLVINASAGSGKTYSLVKNLLKICLRYPNQAESIRHILALTFTNKAANEMKERIINWLFSFTKENYNENLELQNIKSEFDEEGIHITIEDLHHRAKQILDYVLHHYSTLNIGTIDKFNARLVRSFTYELGLAQNFNLEINAEPFLIEAVDQLLDEIGDNNHISEAFMDFVNYGLDNETRININKNLYDSAKKFISDTHYEALSENKNFEWEAYERKKENLRNEIKADKNQSISLAKEIIQTLTEQDLNIEDFAGGNVNGIAKFFHEVIKFYKDERSDFPIPASESGALQKFASGSSAKGKKKEADIQSILPKLTDLRIDLIAKYINIERNTKILDALLPLKVNSDIQKKLKDIEIENDLVLLSKFNVIIGENLKSEPSSFIYEKVGTQFQHFFFDEFQDTSKMQWENFKPLRDNAIASDNTSFSLVGDPKQSIYRFRGGESQLMLDIISHKEEVAKEAEVVNLEHNWRSAKNIVDFNNQLYYSISRGLEPIHEYIFGEAATQIAKSNINGRVRVNLLENDVKEIFYEEAVFKMRDDIQQCLDNGFELSDICILCRGNTDIFNFSNLLGQQLINYKGQEQYIKSISESGLTIGLSYTIKALIEFLNWKANPDNYQFFIKMLYHLNHLGRIEIKDFTTEVLKILETKNFVEINTKLKSNYNLDLSSEHILNLNLYNYIEYFLQNFSVENKEVDFLLNFLEMLFNYTQNAGATIKDFLKYWNEEGINQSIQASENIDAIKMMTIHKSKGLEFPIVFLPMRNENKDSKFSNWFDLNNNDELKKVNITGFNKKLLEYDQEISNFNIDNEYKNKIDRFCLQYVATTRAVEQLYLYLEKPNKSANHLEIIDYINAKRPSTDNEERDSFDLYDIEEADLKKQKNKTKNLVEKLSITALKGGNSENNNIQIATPSKNYQERVAKVRIGIFVHEILSKIKSNLDLEKVLEKYELEGVFTSEERINIEQRIFEIINSEAYRHFFVPDLKIISERDIMISENGETKVLRPDRLIETEHGFIIIDFKTGDKKDKHKQQIEVYKNALEKLGKKVSETHLIYI